MDKSVIEQITQGLETSFINRNIPSNLAYRPQFISNNYKQGRKVISSIEEELLSCDQFIIEVRADKKKDNKGNLRQISKLTFRLHDPIREDLKDYLETY